MRTVMSVLLLLLGLTLPVAAQDATPAVPAWPPDGSRYALVEVASGFERPVFVTGANDGTNRLFIVEQGGRIWIMQGGATLPSPFLDVSALVSRDANERGLLGLAFDPNYAENGQFFINYTDVNGDTAVLRYRVSADNPNLADPDSAEYVIRVGQPYPNHNGGDIAFGPDGYLYVGMGDGGSAGDPQRHGQDPQSLLGKMLRLDVDSGTPYAIPADNPSVNNPALLPEIWAIGLRNPWRFSFDRQTGDLYIADVGQNQWEEVNFQPADSPGGENYGWNIMEGTHRYSGEPVIEGLTAPFAEYSHSQGCSVTGGYVYRGAALPDLQGVYLFADYCSGHIWASARDGDGNWQTSLFKESGLVVSSFGQDDSGELYVIHHGGGIWKLVTAG